jgi:lipopolysaccharide transport system permease protein
MTDRTTRGGGARGDLFGHGHVTMVRPREGWQGIDLPELWAYRELIHALVLRDIRVRYKQTVLGAAWAIIQPVATMIIFTVIFGRLAGIPSDDQPYPVFVYCALLPWTLFANGVAASGQSLLGSAALVAKVYFPRLIVPLASLGACVVDFLVASSVLVALLIYYGAAPGAGLLLAPLLVAGVMALTLGVGLVFAALTVTYRDFRFVIPFMLQIWMFLTPVVYSHTLIPERWQWLLLLNPMTGYVAGLRATFLGTEVAWGAVAVSILLTGGMLAAGMAVFQRAERRFADVI